MKRRRTSIQSGNPFLIWTNLAVKAGEMMLASAQVISHRTSRIAMAGPIPSARDQKEFTLMGQEKIEAVAESAQAVAIRMMSINQQLGTLVFNQLVNGASEIMVLATRKTMTQSGKLQAELICDAMAHSAVAASHLSSSFARLAHHGLKPIHSRATGNAKRLRNSHR